MSNYLNELQQKPLTVINLDKIENDYTNLMIAITEDFYLLIFCKWDVSTVMWSHSDINKWLF